jgi:tellurite resistance protein
MPTEMMAAYLEYREDELLDGVVTAAALIARADGSLQPIEHHQLVDVLAAEDFLFVFTSAEILEAFERKLEDLRKSDGMTAAVERLKCFAGRPMAGLMIAVAEEIAVADCLLHRREERMLELIRTALDPRSAPAAAGRDGAGAAK